MRTHAAQFLDFLGQQAHGDDGKKKKKKKRGEEEEDSMESGAASAEAEGDSSGAAGGEGGGWEDWAAGQAAGEVGFARFLPTIKALLKLSI
jgi:hypothetical protein